MDVQNLRLLTLANANLDRSIPFRVSLMEFDEQGRFKRDGVYKVSQTDNSATKTFVWFNDM